MTNPATPIPPDDPRPPCPPMPSRSQTARLELDRPAAEDLDELHALCADSRVWTHFPSLRHAATDLTAAMLDQWRHDWEGSGLGIWIVRTRNQQQLIGYAGCSVRDGVMWNLGYRFTPESQGHGYATEAATEAVRQAQHRDPSLPVVAYLVEHNTSSAAVAARVGLTLQHRGPDTGNPDPAVQRLIYADRPLTAAVLRAALR